MATVAKQNQRHQKDQISFENHLKYETLQFSLIKNSRVDYNLLCRVSLTYAWEMTKMEICTGTLEYL